MCARAFLGKPKMFTTQSVFIFGRNNDDNFCFVFFLCVAFGSDKRPFAHSTRAAHVTNECRYVYK